MSRFLNALAFVSCWLSEAALAQDAYLKAEHPTAGDAFGGTIALSGGTLVIGAASESSAAAGIDGDQTDDSLPGAGAAYVFVKNGTGWVQEAYLKASHPGNTDLFGWSVAICCDTIVVGALKEDSGALAGPADNGTPDAGAAYVFVRSGSTWIQQAFLKASNADPADWFGESVAIAGDVIVVGASMEQSAATGVDGNQADNSFNFRGAAYVFERVGSSWQQTAYLKSPPMMQGLFGISAAAEGDRVVVGGYGGDVASVFRKGGNAWFEEAVLTASNAEVGDYFGWSVAISGSRIAVGALAEGSGAAGNPLDNSVPGAGAIYLFDHDGLAWSESAYLKPAVVEADGWGDCVALSGDRVVAGSRYEAGGSQGKFGDPLDNGAPRAGAAITFVQNGSGWFEEVYAKASNTDGGDMYGSAVALEGDMLCVGAPGEASAAGAGDDPLDNSALFAGAAYVCTLDDPPTFYCTPKSSAAGCVALISSTSPGQHPVSGAGDYCVTAEDVDGQRPGLVFGGVSGSVVAPFGGGTLCVQPPLRRGPIQTTAGSVGACDGALATEVNDGILFPAGLDAGPGNSGWYQYWYRDPDNGAGIIGSALSGAVQLTFR